MSQQEQEQAYEPSEAELRWEEQRAKWLSPKAGASSTIRPSETSVKRLERILNPKTDAERKAAKPIVAGIKERLSDKTPLKEPMPLRLMVSLLYTSWLDDGTITPEMLKAGRAGTDADEPKQVKSSSSAKKGK